MPKLDFKKSIDNKRFNTSGGRFYGPTDLDVFNQYDNPLKPSWTNVANIESSPVLTDWFKNNGKWSDIIGPTTAILGTIGHSGVDYMNQGKEVTEEWIVDTLENYYEIRLR